MNHRAQPDDARSLPGEPAAFQELLADVSHEMNSPLAIIVAQAALMELEAGGRTAKRAASIRRASERLVSVVKTFLDRARHDYASPADCPCEDAMHPLACTLDARDGAEASESQA